MSDDQIISFIRDEFNRLHARLDEHFLADNEQDKVCNQHATEWRMFKWVGGLGLTSLLGWFNFK
jgi:hypothetical protein